MDCLVRKNMTLYLLFNSLEILDEKSIPDALLAWKVFTDQLPPEKAKKTSFILKTDPVDGNGTDIPAVIEYLFDNSHTNITSSRTKIIHFRYEPFI